MLRPHSIDYTHDGIPVYLIRQPVEAANWKVVMTGPSPPSVVDGERENRSPYSQVVAFDFISFIVCVPSNHKTHSHTLGCSWPGSCARSFVVFRNGRKINSHRAQLSVNIG